MKKASICCAKCSYHILEEIKISYPRGFKFKLVCTLQNEILVLSNFPDSLAPLGISNTCPFQ